MAEDLQDIKSYTDLTLTKILGTDGTQMGYESASDFTLETKCGNVTAGYNDSFSYTAEVTFSSEMSTTNYNVFLTLAESPAAKGTGAANLYVTDKTAAGFSVTAYFPGGGTLSSTSVKIDWMAVRLTQ